MQFESNQRRQTTDRGAVVTQFATSSHWRLCAIRLVAVMLSLLAISTAWSTQLVVTALTVQGQAVNQADIFFHPAVGAARAISTRIGDRLPTGTQIRVPLDTTLQLESSHGNRLLLHGGARFVAAAIASNGEAHVSLAGRIEFLVRSSLDFFNVRYERITASVKGTAFVIDASAPRAASVAVSEGTVEVERRGAVRIVNDDRLQSEQNSDFSAIEVLRLGDIKSYPLDAESYLFEFQNYAAAEAYFRNAYQIAQASGDPSQLARATLNLMSIYHRMGRDQAALELEPPCLEAAQKVPGLAAQANCLQLAGVAQLGLGRPQDSLDKFTQSKSIRRSLYGDSDHPEFGALLTNEAAAQNALGRPVTALSINRQALLMLQRLYGTIDHPEVARTLSNLAVNYRLLGELPAATQVAEQALAIRRRLYGDRSHPEVASSLTNLGAAYAESARYDLAIATQKHALSMLIELFGGRDSPDIASVLNRLGAAYDQSGQMTPAFESYQQALQMRERLFAGRDHPDLAGSYNNLGRLAQARGDYRLAITNYQQALAMQQRLAAGSDSLDIAATQNNLGTVLYSDGRYSQAAMAFEQSVALRARLLPSRDHAELAATLSNLGVVRRAQGQLEAAREAHQQSLAMRQRLYGPGDHPDLAGSLNNLGRVELQVKDLSNAQQHIERSMAMRQRLFAGRDHADLAVSLTSIGQMSLATGRIEHSIAAFQDALAMRRRLYGDVEVRIDRTAAFATEDAAEATPFSQGRLPLSPIVQII